MAFAGAAGAATVTNGDFEAGDLTGWQTSASGSAGYWTAYRGESFELEEGFSIPVPPPPQGQYAAITVQDNPGTRILYQAVTLEPGYDHQLSLLAYYEVNAPISSPETLDYEVEPNEQYRIDVMRAGAPLESVDPSDVLVNVFRTRDGDPTTLPPTELKADLSAFAGQTVVLRFAEVDNQDVFNAGVDSVAITSSAPAPPSPPAPPPAELELAIGKLKLNKKKGTARLALNVPGTGSLKIVDSKKKNKRVRGVKRSASGAGTLWIPIKPTKRGRRALLAKGKLPVMLRAAFTSTGGETATAARRVVLRLSSPKKR